MRKLLVNSELSKELSNGNDYNKYKNLTLGSGVKLLWLCSHCGGGWLASVNSRKSGSGCPKCSIKNRTYKSNNYLYEVNEELFEKLDAHHNG